MTPSLGTWLAVPAIGGVIGYVTNWIAVKMIFRPIRERRFLGIRIQGLIGRRQKELARSIGNVVGSHLVEHKDIVRGLNKLDFAGILSDVLDKGLEPKVRELRALPLIGGFLTEERVRSLRDAIASSVMANQDQVLDAVEKGLAEGLDVPRLVEEKVADFPVEKVEAMILEVSARELRAIEWLGGLLGALIGIGQVFVTWALG